MTRRRYSGPKRATRLYGDYTPECQPEGQHLRRGNPKPKSFVLVGYTGPAADSLYDREYRLELTADEMEKLRRARATMRSAFATDEGREYARVILEAYRGCVFEDIRTHSRVTVE